VTFERHGAHSLARAVAKRCSPHDDAFQTPLVVVAVVVVVSKRALKHALCAAAVASPSRCSRATTLSVKRCSRTGSRTSAQETHAAGAAHPCLPVCLFGDLVGARACAALWFS
jgi:hypothetical protein